MAECVMTGLRAALADYVSLRRGLGFSLQRDAKLLAQFVTYLEDKQASTVTVDDALAWARQPAGASPSWLAFRMRVVRGFAAYLRAGDPAAEVPPPGLLPGGRRRAVPYLYSDADISALLAQAERLRTLRPATIRTLIGLLVATGMRVGEVIGLDDQDFDAGRGLLVVKAAKGGKWRQVPLHPTATAALERYRQLRDARFPRPASPALLVSSGGTRLLHVNVSQTFTKLARDAGLAGRPGCSRPRLHDLRHTFAVRTLLDWCRDGADVAARMPLLSTYLGHADPADTYWYLQAAPELLAEAARRLEPGGSTGGRQ
jgi:integrase/recombinase XerD